MNYDRSLTIEQFKIALDKLLNGRPFIGFINMTDDNLREIMGKDYFEGRNVELKCLPSEKIRDEIHSTIGSDLDSTILLLNPRENPGFTLMDPQMLHVIFIPSPAPHAMVVLREYERGWGSKDFDATPFYNIENARSRVAEVNNKNTAPSAPDYYIVARLETDPSDFYDLARLI